MPGCDSPHSILARKEPIFSGGSRGVIRAGACDLSGFPALALITRMGLAPWYRLQYRRFRRRGQVVGLGKNCTGVHVKGLRDHGLKSLFGPVANGVGGWVCPYWLLPGKEPFSVAGLPPLPTGHIATAVATTERDVASIFLNDFNVNCHNCHTCHIFGGRSGLRSTILSCLHRIYKMPWTLRLCTRKEAAQRNHLQRCGHCGKCGNWP